MIKLKIEFNASICILCWSSFKFHQTKDIFQLVFGIAIMFNIMIAFLVANFGAGYLYAHTLLAGSRTLLLTDLVILCLLMKRGCCVFPIHCWVIFTVFLAVNNSTMPIETISIAVHVARGFQHCICTQTGQRCHCGIPVPSDTVKCINKLDWQPWTKPHQNGKFYHPA